MQLSIEEYFKYHPPTTPERIALHDRVNQESLEILNELTWLDPLAKSFDEIADTGLNLAHEVCQDSVCLKWAVSSLASAIDAVKTLESQKESVEASLMYIQQFRMFLNQGIVIDELVQKQLVEGMVSVTTEDIGTLSELTRFVLVPEPGKEYHPHSSDSRHPESAYTAKSIDVKPPSSMSKYFEYQNGLERIRVDALDRVDQFNKLSAGDSIKRWDSDINGFLRLQVDRTTEATEHQGKTIDVSMPNFHSIDRDEYVLGGWEQI